MNNGRHILNMPNVRIVGMEPTARAKECLMRIQEVLSAYDCFVVPIVSIRGDGRVVGGFEVVPKQKEVK